MPPPATGRSAWCRILWPAGHCLRCRARFLFRGTCLFGTKKSRGSMPRLFLKRDLRIDFTGLRCREILFLGADAEQGRLRFRGLSHLACFIQLIHATFRSILAALALAL